MVSAAHAPIWIIKYNIRAAASRRYIYIYMCVCVCVCVCVSRH